MPGDRVTHFKVLIALLFTAVFLFPSAGYSVPKPVQIDITVAVGFSPQDYISRINCWTPVHILLENKEKTIMGYFELTSEDDERIYRVPFISPKHSTKLFHTYIHPESGGTGKNEYKVRVVTRDFSLPPEIIPVMALKENDYYFVGLSRDNDGLRYLNYLINREVKKFRSEDEERIFVKINYGKSELLPEHTIGYEGVSALLWDGASVSSLTTKQLQSLNDWLYCGGIMFLFVGENWQYLKASPLEQIMNLRFTGSKLLENKDSKSDTDRPLVLSLTDELTQDWEVLHSIDGLPLLARKNLGLGKIYYCATRFTENTPHKEDIVKLVINERAENIFGFIHGDDPDITLTKQIGDLYQSFSIQLPPLKSILLFLLIYYFLIIPINFVVFKLLKHLEWGWYLIPVVAIIFSGMLYAYAYVHYSKEYHIAQAHIIKTGANCEKGVVKSRFAIFSPTKRELDVQINNIDFFPSVSRTKYGYGIPAGRQSGFGNVESLNLDFSDTFILKHFLLYKWSIRTFDAESIVDLGNGIDVRLTLSDENLHYTITNNTPFSFYEARLKTQFGDIPIVYQRPFHTGRRYSRPTDIIAEEQSPFKSNKTISGDLKLKDIIKTLYSNQRQLVQQFPFQSLSEEELASSWLKSTLSGGKAVLLLSTFDFQLPLSDVLSNVQPISNTTLLVHCKFESKDTSHQLTKDDFNITLSTTPPTVDPSKAFLLANNPEFEAKKKFYFYDKTVTIHFSPKSPGDVKADRATIYLFMYLTDAEFHYRNILTLGSDYNAYVYNYSTQEWTRINWGIIQNKNEKNVFFDPMDGMRVQIRLNSPEVEMRYNNSAYYYPFKEAEVFFISDINLGIIVYNNSNSQSSSGSEDK